MNLALIIFGVIFVLIVTEKFDKSVLALLGGVLMVLFGVLSFEEAIAAVNFQTILLLMSMMIIVEVAKKSGLFTLISLKIANFTRGNPLFIYILFVLITAVFSAFLDNVTTILIIVPTTIALLKELNIPPKVFVISEIMMSNIGGALTLIGDASNILIGSASSEIPQVAPLSFNDFILNLWIPVSVSALVVLGSVIIANWKILKPISVDLKKLFLAAVLIKKFNVDFQKQHIHREFLYGVLILLIATIIGFFLHDVLHVPLAVIALTGSLCMLLFLHRHIVFSQKLAAVEWSTLMFFSGLFVMVAAVEKSGFLDHISEFILNFSQDYTVRLILIVWVTGIVSMIFDNIPFVTVMIPVIQGIQVQLEPGMDPHLLWWALSLGACLGGNGTIFGGSANVVGVGVAQSQGVKISFFDYIKIALPLTFVNLGVVTVYFLFFY